MVKKVKKAIQYIRKNGVTFAVRAVCVKMRQKTGGKLPLVSVVMPVYNVEPYLEQALDSLLNQSMKHFELIAVDDGSTDHSLDILNRYAASDQRIEVYTQKNQYAGVARNTGLSHARGEYVIFLDSDDFFEKTLLQETYYKAKMNQADIILFTANNYENPTGKNWKAKGGLRKQYVPSKQPFSYKDCPETLYQMTSSPPWTKMYRREFIVSNGLQYQALYNANDVYFTFTALALAKKIVTLDKALVNYRIGLKTNLQSSTKRYFYEAYRAWHEKLREIGVLDEVRRSYVNRALEGCMYNLRAVADPDKKREVYEMLKNEGFEALEIYGHEESYFYNKAHYETLRMIQNESFETYMEAYGNS